MAPIKKELKLNESTYVDLYNPTLARRVIPNGLKPLEGYVTVESGATVRDVELAQWVIDELKKRTEGTGKENADVKVFPANKAPEHKTLNDVSVLVPAANHIDV